MSPFVAGEGFYTGVDGGTNTLKMLHAMIGTGEHFDEVFQPLIPALQSCELLN